jgi:hypothetical protein
MKDLIGLLKSLLLEHAAVDNGSSTTYHNPQRTDISSVIGGAMRAVGEAAGMYGDLASQRDAWIVWAQTEL